MIVAVQGMHCKVTAPQSASPAIPLPPTIPPPPTPPARSQPPADGALTQPKLDSAGIVRVLYGKGRLVGSAPRTPASDHPLCMVCSGAERLPVLLCGPGDGTGAPVTCAALALPRSPLCVDAPVPPVCAQRMHWWSINMCGSAPLPCVCPRT